MSKKTNKTTTAKREPKILVDVRIEQAQSLQAQSWLYVVGAADLDTKSQSMRGAATIALLNLWNLGKEFSGFEAHVIDASWERKSPGDWSETVLTPVIADKVWSELEDNEKAIMREVAIVFHYVAVQSPNVLGTMPDSDDHVNPAGSFVCVTKHLPEKERDKNSVGNQPVSFAELLRIAKTVFWGEELGRNSAMAKCLERAQKELDKIRKKQPADWAKVDWDYAMRKLCTDGLQALQDLSEAREAAMAKQGKVDTVDDDDDMDIDPATLFDGDDGVNDDTMFDDMETAQLAVA
jgi:hypothetical protein